MTLFQYKGSAVETTLAAGISNVATSITLGSGTGWPDGAGSYVFVATLGDPDNGDTEEKVLCSAQAAGVLTVQTRGYDDTPAQTWPLGTKIRHTLSALAMQEASDHIADSTIHMSAATHAAIAHTQAMMGTDSVGSAQIIAGSVGSDEIAANAVGSSELADGAVDTAALQNGAVDINKIATSAIALLNPAGQITAYGGATAPFGWLLCDGSAVSRATYASLFTAIGTAYGVGDGTTTFNLPDLRQRFPLGKAAAGTGSTLGATGGTIDHVHDLNTSSSYAAWSGAASGGTNRAMRRKTTESWTPTHGAADGALGAPGGAQTVGTELGGQTDSDNAPFQVVNYIIKT